MWTEDGEERKIGKTTGIKRIKTYTCLKTEGVRIVVGLIENHQIEHRSE